jgi:adenosylhomocysteine nucleosidase
MRVLVTFAVDEEFAPWRKLRQFRFIDYDGLRLWKTKSDGLEITALLTGIGTQAAAQAMELMMSMADENRHFDICVSSGLAGALKEGLIPGDIIAPQVLLAEQIHADLGSDQLRVDDDLRQRALGAGAIGSDCLFTTEKVLVKAQQKQACSSRAQLVDMESFEIVKEAKAWGARTVVLRAISDVAEEDLPIDFNRTISKESQVSVAKVVIELAKNPFALPRLLRFGRQSRYAAERLATFLDGYVQALSAMEPGSLKQEAAVQ